LDITTALQQYQWQGTPLWISPASGGPAGYLLYSYVAYDAGAGIQIWESQLGTTISPNTSIPGSDTNWLVVSGNAQGVAPGTIVDFAGFLNPPGYFFCNGHTPVRADYPRLFNAICPLIACNTTASSTTITVTGGHGNTIGLYVGMPVEGSGIQSGTVVASIPSFTSTTAELSLPPTATATGVLLRFFSWGNGDGSNTFTLPNLGNRVTAAWDTNSGSGLPPEVPGTNISQAGQTTGVSARPIIANNLPAHTHPNTAVTTMSVNGNNNQGAIPSNMIVGGAGTGVFFSTFPSATITTTMTNAANATTNAAFDIVQPTALVSKIIKY
jgi:microcystin-dependent protein